MAKTTKERETKSRPFDKYIHTSPFRKRAKRASFRGVLGKSE